MLGTRLLLQLRDVVIEKLTEERSFILNKAGTAVRILDFISLFYRERLCVIVYIFAYYYYYYYYYLLLRCGPSSSVGIATDYGLDGSGSKSRWGRDFTPVLTGPGAHPASP